MLIFLFAYIKHTFICKLQINRLNWHANTYTMAKLSTDTSLRIDRETLEKLSFISKKEGVSIKKTMASMANFFIANRLSLSDTVENPGKVGERTIRILRAMEKDLFVPMLLKITKIETFQESLKIDAQNLLDLQEEIAEKESEKGEVKAPVSEVKNTSFEPGKLSEQDLLIEQLKHKNKQLADQLNSIIELNKLTVKIVTGQKYFVRSFSENDLSQIQNLIEICTTR